MPVRVFGGGAGRFVWRSCPDSCRRAMGERPIVHAVHCTADGWLADVASVTLGHTSVLGRSAS